MESLQIIDQGCKPLSLRRQGRDAKIEEKAHNGKVTVVGGSVGSTFCVYNCSKAAQASGVGLVISYVPDCIIVPLEAQDIGCRVRGFINYNAKNAVEPIVEHINNYSDCLVVGVGIKESATVKYDFFKPILGYSKKTVVVDADLIEVIYAHPDILLRRETKEIPHIVTLNRRESAVLFGPDAPEDEVQRFADLSNSYVMLKGRISKLVSPGGTKPEELYEGEIPRMAVAGMGDVLSGLIGGYIARGSTPIQAIRMSFSRRSRAAKKYLEHYPNTESVTPRDIIQILKTGEDSVAQ